MVSKAKKERLCLNTMVRIIPETSTMTLKKGEKSERNDPCSCGSGRKYKKCCLREHEGLGIRAVKNLPEEELEVLREAQERKHELFSAILGDMHGYYLRHIQMVHKGKRVRAVYGTLHLRPPQETFHEFIIYILTSTLGEEWRKEQMGLPEEDRHFIMKCYIKYHEWLRKNADNEEFKRTGKFSGQPDGYSQWILSLAFDIYCLQYTKHLSPSVVSRLKQNTDEFQGARYEVTVAAIFARAGFDIEFLDDKNKGEVVGEKHCEFIATDLDSELKIAVEAKSKQRDGVLHRKGEKNDEDLMKGNVHNLIKKAMLKEVGELPYFIFIDLNTPLSLGTKIEEKAWVRDIFDNAKKQHNDTATTKDNAIIFTNFAHHYQEEEIASGSESLYSFSLKPTYLIAEKITNKIINVINHYSAVPELDMIFEELEANSSFAKAE